MAKWSSHLDWPQRGREGRLNEGHNIVVGIDNGISGGLVAISSHDSAIIGKLAMPSKKHRSRNEIDMDAIWNWMFKEHDFSLTRTLFVVEEPNNSRNASTAYSVASSFHSLRGVFVTLGFNWKRITPQSWQKSMLGKVPAGGTKDAATAKAREIWPLEKWLATSRCSKPHEGLIDAALIAEHARRLKL